MLDKPFQTRQPSVIDNPKLRIPQVEAFQSLAAYARSSQQDDREIGVIMPVGCGKSGCIAVAPFAFKSERSLVVAPGVNIARQLYRDFDPSHPGMFYTKCGILPGQPFPEPAQIAGRTTNRADLEEADVVITNIQQLQGQANRWLASLPEGFFDLILFDEGHHNVAQSWETLRDSFPSARIVNFSATPMRADGQRMAGRTVYSYPVFEAIQQGYIKRIKAIVLNPSTLRYVRHDDDQEVEVGLDDVRRLGEQEADFRRSIVTSPETLITIVDASVRELDKLRDASDDNRLKIIASALNFHHCRQIVEAYRARGRKADYVHSRQDSASNQQVMHRLENHELDVIVQVRKLGEGFDHPYLSVAAVFSIFANLSPFVQFVGRIMLVIKHNAPSDPLNQGSVVFHAGGNVANRWTDFQEFSEADQEYFDQLLPMEALAFDSGKEIEVTPTVSDECRQGFDVRAQSEVHLEEIPLIADNPRALAALKTLQEEGFTPKDIVEAYELLEPVPVTKVRARQAKRSSLDMRVRTEVGRILGERGVNAQGHELDRRRLGQTNFVVMKAAIDRYVNAFVGRGAGERHEFTRSELDRVEYEFPHIVQEAINELFDANN